MSMQDLSVPPGRPAARATPRVHGLLGRVFLDRERRLALGWRLLSYLILVVVATGGLAAVLAGAHPPVGRNLLVHLVAVALVVAITWLYRRLIDRRGWHDLGLPLPGRAQLVVGGAGFGLGVVSIVGFFGVGWVLGWVRVDGSEVAERGVVAVVGLLAAGLVMYAASALFQELAFRGYLFQNLAERLSTRTAAVVAGLIFAALHLPGDEFLAATGAGGGHRPHPDGVLPRPDPPGHRVAVAGDRLPSGVELDDGLCVLTRHGRRA
jgi:membrane protease YdiL (CAAX protease family)